MMEALSYSETSFLQEPHAFTKQKTPLFIVTAVNTSNLTWHYLAGLCNRDVSPVKYELGFYIPEDGTLHSHRREHLKSYTALTGWTM
jgi:hypothetical protein